jgi:hypothetical protein
MAKPTPITFDDLTEREREIFGEFDLPAQAHPMVRDEDGRARFRGDPVIGALIDRQAVDLNYLWGRLGAGDFEETDLRRFYRDMGYSLGGYSEVFTD